MAVDQGREVEVIGSPTEIAEDSDEIKSPGTKTEKRKRERRRRRGEAAGVPTGSDSELDSPSKRPQRGDADQPVSARELRELLQQHAHEMREAWGTFENRLGAVEEGQQKQSGAIASLAGRTKVVERDVQQLRQSSDLNHAKVDNLVEDVKKLKVQIESTKAVPINRDDRPADPWGEYLHRQGRRIEPRGELRGRAEAGGVAGALGGETSLPAQSSDNQDSLSDEDRRTLIVGGWLQDTRKGVIEEESLSILQLDQIKPLIDVERLAVYGPRRSVGMLKFAQRPDEASMSQVKDRMWKVVKAIAALKHVLESTKSAGDDKIMWAAFMKTKAARQRTAHISMVRRVAMNLAADSKNEMGGVLNVEHTTPQAYDMDWSAGTIWCGIHKLASSTHRSPKSSEVVTMPGGWVNLDAVGLVAGCSSDAAKAAFELEL